MQGRIGRERGLRRGGGWRKPLSLVQCINHVCVRTFPPDIKLLHAQQKGVAGSVARDLTLRWMDSNAGKDSHPSCGEDSKKAEDSKKPKADDHDSTAGGDSKAGKDDDAAGNETAQCKRPRAHSEPVGARAARPRRQRKRRAKAEAMVGLGAGLQRPSQPRGPGWMPRAPPPGAARP